MNISKKLVVGSLITGFLVSLPTGVQAQSNTQETIKSYKK